MSSLLYISLESPPSTNRKREAEGADKIEVAPGVAVGSLRCFRAALIGPTQGVPKRRRLHRQGSLKTLGIRRGTVDVIPLGATVRWLRSGGVSDGSRLAV